MAEGNNQESTIKVMLLFAEAVWELLVTPPRSQEMLNSIANSHTSAKHLGRNSRAYNVANRYLSERKRLVEAFMLTGLSISGCAIVTAAAHASVGLVLAETIASVGSVFNAVRISDTASKNLHRIATKSETSRDARRKGLGDKIVETYNPAMEWMPGASVEPRSPQMDYLIHFRPPEGSLPN